MSFCYKILIDISSKNNKLEEFLVLVFKKYLKFMVDYSRKEELNKCIDNYSKYTLNKYIIHKEKDKEQ